MNFEEIKSYLSVGSTKSVCVDKKLSSDFPGYVRSIYIHDGNCVSIEFENYGYDEAGAYYWGEFPSLESAVETLQEYLNTPIQEWTNYTKTGSYPDLLPEIDISKGGEYLIAAISSRTVPLPKKGNFKLRSGYYSQFERMRDK